MLLLQQIGLSNMVYLDVYVIHPHGACFATIIFGFKRDVVGFNSGLGFDFNCAVLIAIEPKRRRSRIWCRNNR